MIRRFMTAIALAVALAPAVDGSPARITFSRMVRPPHDLAADNLVAVYAIGDSEKVTTFVDQFVQYAGRAGHLRVDNAVENNQHLASFNEKALRQLRHDFPADAYIGVSLFTCAGEARSGEIRDANLSGERVRSKVQWFDAVCSAKLDVRKPDGKRLLTFMIHGEGTSPRVLSLGEDDRDVAYEQATRYAAISAAESIAPRTVRESIELDDRAPEFDEVVEMIRSDRLTEARALWEAELARHRDSASLNYDLAAVCEALGDIPAAEKYYRNAARLAPGETRYRTELSLLRKRNPVGKPR